MNVELLKRLGNIDQLAGIRESRIIRGRGEGIEIAQFYNAAGLSFSVTPDRCMDIYDLSYKGVNFSFHSCNGLTSSLSFKTNAGEFAEQWPGGMLVTCGLDNVGGHCEDNANYPVHGRISNVPASNFGTETYWKGEKYILGASGEIHQTRMYTRHLSIRRRIETELNSREIKLHDVITNFNDHDEPLQLLYHFNFGYPILDENSLVKASMRKEFSLTDISADSVHMMAPIDGRPQELFLNTHLPKKATAMIYNPNLKLGAYIRWDTENLPNFMEWKNMKSHDYVLAIEPCNTMNLNRLNAINENNIRVIPAYSNIETTLIIGIIDGNDEAEAISKKI